MDNYMFITRTKMKLKSLFVLLAACLLCGCSLYRTEVIVLAGFDAEQHFRVLPFSEIDVHSAIDVVICDSVSDICAQTDANLIPYLRIAQSGQRLSVGFCNGVRWSGVSHCRVLIPTQPALSDINVSGASSLFVEQALTAPDVDINVSGASAIDVLMVTRDADLNISGSSSATLQGSTHRMEVSVSGASRLLSDKKDGRFLLVADEVEGSVSGSSVMNVHSDGEIDCNVSDASTIYYTGNARTHNSECTGSSLIIHE